MTYKRQKYCAAFGLLWLMLAGSVWAQVSDLKAMILMPGSLIEAHADEENNCEACHSSFDKSAQNELCLACHETVAADITGASGYHGRAPNVATIDCKSCHRDHKGRGFDSSPLDADSFNHKLTDFPLQGGHNGVPCQSCHEAGEAFRATESECQACHGEQDPHNLELGKDCGACHNNETWRASETYDHESGGFPLLGAHQATSCTSCHAGQHYALESSSCVACHGTQDSHRGQFGEACDSCHSPDTWDDATFDHLVETEFALTGAHAEQSCSACHRTATSGQTPAKRCVACHREADVHATRHGDDCAGCHDTDGWKRAQFNHGDASGWPLLGRHDELECLQCHRGTLDEDLPTVCRSCHQADDVHRGGEESNCAACHSPSGWEGAEGFDHELASFPLEGIHAVASCKGCHRNYRYKQAESACVECHGTEDAHKGALGDECGSCHTPNGWALWVFDHNRQTDFPLQDSHAKLSCSSCHAGGDDPNAVNGSCIACHAADDRHRGEFGEDCENCHLGGSFGEVKWPD